MSDNAHAPDWLLYDQELCDEILSHRENIFRQNCSIVKRGHKSPHVKTACDVCGGTMDSDVTPSFVKALDDAWLYRLECSGGHSFSFKLERKKAGTA